MPHCLGSDNCKAYKDHVFRLVLYFLMADILQARGEEILLIAMIHNIQCTLKPRSQVNPKVTGGLGKAQKSMKKESTMYRDKIEVIIFNNAKC